MALLFSAVTVTANDDKIELLVSGIPKEYDEMEGWTDFDDFVNLLREESEVSVHAQGYLYGEGEIVDASPQEIAYFLKRMETDDHFLTDHCTKMENAEFSFTWSPEELFGMEMEWDEQF